MRNSHSQNTTNNFYQWHFVIQLQELKLVFGQADHGLTEQAEGQTDMKVNIVILIHLILTSLL